MSEIIEVLSGFLIDIWRKVYLNNAKDDDDFYTLNLEMTSISDGRFTIADCDGVRCCFIDLSVNGDIF